MLLEEKSELFATNKISVISNHSIFICFFCSLWYMRRRNSRLVLLSMCDSYAPFNYPRKMIWKQWVKIAFAHKWTHTLFHHTVWNIVHVIERIENRKYSHLSHPIHSHILLDSVSKGEKNSIPYVVWIIDFEIFFDIFFIYRQFSCAEITMKHC